MREQPRLKPGQKLLDRRAFLGDAALGLSGIALTALLAEQGLLAAAPDQTQTPRYPGPIIRPEAPLAPRPPHFPPRARRVLVIFCSGAVSHVDSFDYKPELIKRNGQPRT